MEARRGRDEWQAVERGLGLARRLAPGDAGLEADSAELLTWWVLGAAGSPEAHRGAIAGARSHQLRALAARPTWGQAWARLAEVEFLAGRPGAELAPLLERAMLLAPWEPGVQAAVTRVGLAVWDDLPAAVRAGVEHNVVRAASIDGEFNAIALAALHHGRLDWLEALVADHDWHVGQLRALRARAGH